MSNVDLLPPRTLEEVLKAFPTLRQSTLAKADNCLLSTLFELEGHSFSNAAQARGIIGHRAAERIMLTMAENGEVRMPVEEALQILYETCAQRDVPDSDLLVLPMVERRMLRMAITRLVEREFDNLHRIIAVEQRLGIDPPVTVTYPRPGGGFVERILTGQPDVLIAEPPNGAIVLDWKFSYGVPPAGDPNDEHIDDPQHVSYQGYFQQRFYALLVMRTYPSIDYVRLREFYPIKSAARYGTVLRSDLEHVERELADIAEILDRVVATGHEGEGWKPQPGRHCSYCAKPQSCTIDREKRIAEEGITSWEEAQEVADRCVVSTETRKRDLKALKAWADAHGPIPVKSAKGRYEFRWKQSASGSQTFGMHVPDESDRGPRDPNLDQIFREVRERIEKEEQVV